MRPLAEPRGQGPTAPLRRAGSGLLLWLAPMAALALYPWTGATSLRLLMLTQVFMLVTVASSWNLVGGMTGYMDFGHAVFFGVGAYGMGILVTRAPLLFAPQLSPWLALPLAAAGAAVFALAIGWPALRLRGPYFSIAMLGTFVATREVVRLLRPVTGGGGGLDLPPVLDRLRDYYLTLGLMGAAVGAIAWIRRSEFGHSLLAIREDEVGAEMRGIHTTLHKMAAFAVSAFLTGAVGALWAWQNTTLDPDIVFVEARTVDMVMTCLLGGLGTVWGPPLGAVLLFVLRDVLWSRLLELHLLAEGLALVALVLFLPDGLLGTLGRPRRRRA